MNIESSYEHVDKQTIKPHDVTLCAHYLFGENIIIFRPCKDVPGYKARVILNDVGVDWVPDCMTESKASAAFFFNKYFAHLTTGSR